MTGEFSTEPRSPAPLGPSFRWDDWEAGPLGPSFRWDDWGAGPLGPGFRWDDWETLRRQRDPTGSWQIELGGG